jgi:1-acyl-sn-glycerol-3-phosphate acyltransferase
MWVILIAGVVGLVSLIRWQWSGVDWLHFFGKGVNDFFARCWHGMAVVNKAPLPQVGSAILVSNHTCSADPAFVVSGWGGPISFLMAKEYYHLSLVRGLFEYLGCVPVSRDGRDGCAIRRALRRLDENRVVCVFPEAWLSNYGRPRLRRGKGGAALLALRSRLPVYPVLILGGPQTNNLVRAWLQPSRGRVIFGRAVDLSAYLDRPINRRLIEEVTRHLMNRIEALRPMGRITAG